MTLPESEINVAYDARKEPTDNATSPTASNITESPVSPTVACIPAHDESDEIVALMGAILLRRRGVATTLISADQSAAERIDQLQSEKASIACISVLPPFADIYARHSVERIHTRLPEMKLIVAFWEASAVSENLTRPLKSVGATDVFSAIAHTVSSIILAMIETLPVQKPEPDIEQQSRVVLERTMVTAG